jgi:hypothetical protein
MTKVYLQPGLRGLSGGMGDWVYKIRKGKTVLGMKAMKNAEPSLTQLARQERFKEAVLFAKSVLANPDLRAFYEPIAAEREISVYALAIADFLKQPSFKPLDLEKYKGNVGDLIVIRANDNIGLAEVQLTINSQTGTLIETGNAVEEGVRSGKWIYTATAQVALGSDVFLKVKGVDHAGNETVHSENPTVGVDEE